MSNFIYYEKLEDYEEQVRKAKEYDKALNDLVQESHSRMELEERINKAILFIEEMYDETDSDNYDILRKEKEFLLKWLRGKK